MKIYNLSSISPCSIVYKIILLKYSLNLLSCSPNKMHKIRKRPADFLAMLESDNSFQTPTHSLNARSTSTKHFSPSNLTRKIRRENLSISRTPSAILPRKVTTKVKRIERKTSKQRVICSQISSRLLSVDRDNHVEYLNECRKAMEDLINLKHPVSELLKVIKDGYENHINSKNNELKKIQRMISIPEAKKSEPNLCNTTSGSIFDRIKIRKGSRIAMRSSQKRDASDFRSVVSVPKLNIKRATVSKQDSSEKITNTRDDTSKNCLYKDYQDEFMSKFDEFSESWRQLILEKKSVNQS